MCRSNSITSAQYTYVDHVLLRGVVALDHVSDARAKAKFPGNQFKKTFPEEAFQLIDASGEVHLWRVVTLQEKVAWLKAIRECAAEIVNELYEADLAQPPATQALLANVSSSGNDSDSDDASNDGPKKSRSRKKKNVVRRSLRVDKLSSGALSLNFSPRHTTDPPSITTSTSEMHLAAIRNDAKAIKALIKQRQRGKASFSFSELDNNGL